MIFEHGDILSVDTDAIVCTINVDFEAYGKISQKIFDLCNPQLIYDIKKLRRDDADHKLLLGQAVSLTCNRGWNLHFQKIIFVAMWDFCSEYNSNLFYKAYINSIRQAFENNLKSVAMPIMAYDGKLNVAAEVVAKVLVDLDRLKNSSEFPLEEIYFVSYKEEHVETFEQIIGRKL